MVEQSFPKDLFADKVEWIKCAIRGALYLSSEALIDGNFKKDMKGKLALILERIS